MKAVEISKTGGAEVLKVKDITLEKPSHDEVTIEQKAIGQLLFAQLSLHHD